jgi:hypothetical protein
MTGSSQTPHLVSFKTRKSLERKKKYGHGSKREPKPKLTALLTASSNLPHRSVFKGLKADASRSSNC